MLRSVLLMLLAAAFFASAQAPPAYVIQRGDTLEIRVFNLPELTQGVVVRPDGMVSVQLAGEIPAAGMTSPELASRLSEVYGKRFRNPEVTISITTFANQTVYVGGEVNQPGAISLGAGLSLTAAIFRSGGFKDSSKPESVTLIHPGPASQKDVNVDSILKGAAPDIPLQAGDIIFVPKSTLNVYVGGEVPQPGLLTVQGKLTLLAAVIKAGGPLRSAATKNLLLIRDSGEPGKPQISQISLDAILKDGTGDLPLKPYDVVFVPKSTISKIDQAVDDYIRRLIPMSMSGGFSYLLNSAVVTGK